MMTTTPATPSIRNALITVAAVIAMSTPLFASASITKYPDNNIRVSYDPMELLSARGQERLYGRLKNASRKLCGASNIQLTGSLRSSVSNTQCYNETLTSAVERLDHPAITALHSH